MSGISDVIHLGEICVTAMKVSNPNLSSWALTAVKKGLFNVFRRVEVWYVCRNVGVFFGVKWITDHPFWQSWLDGAKAASCGVSSCIMGTIVQMRWILSLLWLHTAEFMAELHRSPEHSSALCLVFIWKSQLYGWGVFDLKGGKKKVYLGQNQLHSLILKNQQWKSPFNKGFPSPGHNTAQVIFPFLAAKTLY